MVTMRVFLKTHFICKSGITTTYNSLIDENVGHYNVGLLDLTHTLMDVQYFKMLIQLHIDIDASQYMKIQN